jgi:hypothetical protein
MLDLPYDIRNNGPTFRRCRSSSETAGRPRDTGHFALEDKADEIAGLGLDFLRRTVPRD